MIFVIATIRCNEGCRGKYLEVLKANVPLVKGEKGCLQYAPSTDVDSGVAFQEDGVRDNIVTIIEGWENLDALYAHFKAPHMLTYREKCKGLVEKVTIQVVEPA